MPLTKQYLRYEHSATFGVVCSQKSNAVLLERGKAGPKGASSLRAVVPALEDVCVWDVRTSHRACTLKGDKREVTALAVGADGKTIAAGHEDGMVVLWNMEAQASHVTLSGHKSAVTCLSFDHSSTRLVSGGKDTHLIVWDVVNEAGLFRLNGHKGPITHCVFMRDSNTLISSSKDTFVKLWDLDTQHCFHTIVGHRSEVWSFALLKNETCLVTGSSDLELRVYSLSTEAAGSSSDDGEGAVRLGAKRRAEDSGSRAVFGGYRTILAPKRTLLEAVPFTCELEGTIKKHTHEHVVSLKADQTGRLLLCHTKGTRVEPFLVRSSEELLALAKKREKKAKKKEKKQDKAVEPSPISVDDEFIRLPPMKAGAKVKAIDLLMTKAGQIKVLACLANNTIDIWSLSISPKDIERYSVLPLSAPGHTADVRTVSFSSDDTCIVSGSSNELKVWNRSSQQCIRTLPSGYALCSMVAPGNRHVFLGTKSGDVQLFDIGAGSLLETLPAHTGPVWGIDMSPDKRGFVTGSADHDVKFWEFELVSTDDDSQMTKRVLTAAHVRTLKMTEDVLCVKYSPNQKLLLVALLDSTVKVFFSDTLKFFLSLYGHRLPVLCMDVSSDSTLLVTGSSDKNIKIWGLDFGDCHRSMFAHDDSIMSVQFVPNTHLVFSASKDKTLKCWDADKFELVTTLEGHQGEVWCLAVSHDGDTVVTGSHDHSLRLWERTDEPLILSEERENEREAEFEEAAVKDSEHVIPGESNQEVGLAGKKTLESVKAAERIMEAVQLFREEQVKLAEHREQCTAARKELPLPTPNPILVAFGNLTPERYVLDVLKRIRSSELEESLLVMPFDFVVDLLHLLKHWLDHGWEVELSCRSLFFLLRVHHKQIVANQMLVSIIDSLKQVTKERVTQLKDMVGVNLAGLQFCQRELESAGVHVFDDVSVKARKAKRKKLTVVQ